MVFYDLLTWRLSELRTTTMKPSDLQCNNGLGTKHAQVSLQNTGELEHAQTYLQRHWLSLPAGQADHQSAVLTLIWKMDSLMQWKMIWTTFNVTHMDIMVRTIRSDAHISLADTIVRTTRSDAQISNDNIDHQMIGKKTWHELIVVNTCLTKVANLNSPISHSQPISLHKITRYNVHTMSA